MRATRRLLVVTALLSLSACSLGSDSQEGGASVTAEPDDASRSGRVTLTPTALESAGIRVEEVDSILLPPRPSPLEVPGQVELDPSRIAVISPRAPGRLERMAAVVGDRVQGGQSVAFVSSPDYLAAENDLVQAARRADLLRGTDDEVGAGALLAAARQRLLLLGAGVEEVGALLEGADPGLLLAVRAPFPGTILEALAEPGIAVEAGTPLFRIGDLSVVQVVAQVPETALGSVRPGMATTVRVGAYPGRRFEGQVGHVLDELDPETRTARVLVRVPNPDRALKGGMFGSVRIAGVSAPDAAPASAFSIPSRAVLTDGAERFVFVQLAPGTFEKRVVQLAEPDPGAASSPNVVVLVGLAPGEMVVVEGAMVLRSELAKATLVDPD